MQFLCATLCKRCQICEFNECDFVLRFIKIILLTHHKQHHLTDLDCSKGDCIADFNLQKKTRLTYPGACSLEYQNIIKIVIEDLLQ